MLLKLSFVFKLRNFDSVMKMMSVMPMLVYTRLLKKEVAYIRIGVGHLFYSLPGYCEDLNIG